MKNLLKVMVTIFAISTALTLAGCDDGDATTSDTDSDDITDSDSDTNSTNSTDNDNTDDSEISDITCDNSGLGSDPCIEYFGRMDYSDPDAPKFDWPGIYIRALFEGESIGIKLSGSRVHFDVYIDDELIAPINGAPDATLKTDGSSLYTIDGLAAGEHSVRVEKRSETQSTTSFEGFVADALLAPVKTDRPKIEFIGDSYTVGYGNAVPGTNGEDQDETGRTCSGSDMDDYTDTQRAYAALTAKALNADYYINAISGHGMVRNYGGSTGSSPLPIRYEQTLLSQSSGDDWDFSSWQPDVVMVSLGINDFSTPVGGDESFGDRAGLVAAYKTEYVRFLDFLRSKYPGVKIVCWSANLWDSAANQADTVLIDTVQEIISEQEAAGHSDLSYFSFTNSTGYGCDYHPELATHQAQSDLLAPVIEALIE